MAEIVGFHSIYIYVLAVHIVHTFVNACYIIIDSTSLLSSLPESAIQPSAGAVPTPGIQCTGPYSHIHRPEHDGDMPGGSV